MLVQISDQGEDGKDKIEKVKSEPWIIDMAGVVHLTESQRPGFQNGVASLRPSRQAKRRLTPTGCYIRASYLCWLFVS